MHLKSSSAANNLSIVANSLDPCQTALGLHCLVRFLKHLSRRDKQTTFVVIGALRLKKYFNLRRAQVYYHVELRGAQWLSVRLDVEGLRLTGEAVLRP